MYGFNPANLPSAPEVPHDHRDREWIRTVLATVGALAILALVMIGARVIFGGGALEPLPNSPEGDAYVILEPPFPGTNAAASLGNYGPRGDGLVIDPDSIEFVATAESDVGTAELFGWAAASPGGGPPFDCTAHFFAHDDGRLEASECVPAASQVGPQYSFTRGSTSDEPSMVSVLRAPRAAEWMVVTTSDGLRIVANVKGRTSHASWLSATGDEPQSVAFLGVAGNEIWSG